MRVTQMNAFSESKYVYPERRPPQIIDAPRAPSANSAVYNLKKLLSGFETDDYILAGLLVVLILEGCEDYVLLAVLGYLFIAGLKDS